MSTGSGFRLKTITRRFQVPVLNMGAWYDIFLGGTLKELRATENGRGRGKQHGRGSGCSYTSGGHAGGVGQQESWRPWTLEKNFPLMGMN